MHEIIEEGSKEIYNSTATRKSLSLDNVNLGWIKDKIFVLTGFDEKTEDVYSRIIERAGGIIKSSTVLKTDFLVFNPDFDHETTKLKRAKELISQGKNI